MQGQVLYAPMLTPSQRLAHLARKERNAKICSRASAPEVVASPPIPPPAIRPAPTKPIDLVGAQPPIPNTAFAEAWKMFDGRHPFYGGPSIDSIKRAVCRYFHGVSKLDLESSRRTAGVVRPRQVAMWLCKDITKRSLPEIALQFGNRDHTTVLHAIRKIDCLREGDPQLQADLDAIKASLAEREVQS